MNRASCFFALDKQRNLMKYMINNLITRYKDEPSYSSLDLQNMFCYSAKWMCFIEAMDTLLMGSNLSENRMYSLYCEANEYMCEIHKLTSEHYQKCLKLGKSLTQ